MTVPRRGRRGRELPSGSCRAPQVSRQRRPAFLSPPIAALALLAAALHPLPLASQPPEFAVETYSNLQEVRVLTPEMDSVRGLRPEDFRVRVDGQERPVLFLREEPSRISLAMLVDIGSEMSAEAIADSKRMIHDLIHLLDPEDEVMLAVYDERMHPVAPLTQDRVRLVEGIDDIAPGARPGRWRRLGRLFGSSGLTGGAVDEALLELRRARWPNRIVLVFSSAFGNIGRATQDHLEAAGARFFAVGFGNTGGDALNLWGDRLARSRLLEMTGGVEFSAELLSERIERLRDALKGYYLLAYGPEDASDETERIEISIRDFPDYRVAFAPRTTEEDSFWRR